MRVRAFTLSTCVFCMSFKRFMKEHNIPFEYVDVDLLTGEERAAAIDEAESVCPGCGYPLIMVDDHVIRGFNEPRLREVLGL